MSTTLTLSELNKLVKDTLQRGLPDMYSVVAEISDFNESRGHAYLELIEKNEDDVVAAKSRATVWASTYRMLKPYFESATGHYLRAGLKVLVVVTVEFHEVFGFSLNIRDIDPTYTIGDIEKKRQMILNRLEEEGVSNMNKELDFPVVPQRIAIISSKTAAGYGDFIDQISSNSFGFKFNTKLFQAGMQGENTERSVIQALESVYEELDEFDVVVIIRGGGSKSDLAWFDSYQIAVNIAQFPLPVLTGIGHDRDETVSDTVAFLNLKTPTATADFLVNTVYQFWTYMNDTANDIFKTAKQIIQNEKFKIERIKQNLYPIFSGSIQQRHSIIEKRKESLKRLTGEKIQKYKFKLDAYPSLMRHAVKNMFVDRARKLERKESDLKYVLQSYFSLHNHKLQVLEQKNNFLNPEHVLRRGYSITLQNGKIVKSVNDVHPEDIITTQLIDGTIHSKVKK